jgi:iron uptake system component EfeO
MKSPGSSRVVSILTLSIVLAGMAGCSNDSGSGSDSSSSVDVNATDDGCDLSKTDLTAGTTTFTVTNNGSKVTEFYVYSAGDNIEGEVENIGPGLQRDLIVDLSAGTYEAACKPGMTGDGIRETIHVSGPDAASSSDHAALIAAAKRYQRYIQHQSKALLAATKPFVAAIKAGDVEQAKKVYPYSRTPYERIEPVAETFGGLDPAIDARVNDVAPGDTWTGSRAARPSRSAWGSAATSAWVQLRRRQ